MVRQIRRQHKRIVCRILYHHAEPFVAYACAEVIAVAQLGKVLAELLDEAVQFLLKLA